MSNAHPNPTAHTTQTQAIACRRVSAGRRPILLDRRKLRSLFLVTLTLLLAPGWAKADVLGAWTLGNSNTNRSISCGTTYTWNVDATQTQGPGGDKGRYCVITSSSADCPITVTLTSRSLGNGNGRDYVYIYEGSGTGGTQLARWENNTATGTSVTSTSGVITVRFDHNRNESRNFSLTIYQECCPCTPSFSYEDDYITNITLGTINNTTAFSTGGYGDYTAQSTDLNRGVTANLSLTSSSGTGYHGASVWIDFNDNNIFEESERVGTYANSIQPSTTVTIPLTIPADAATGSHTMRVIYQYNTAGASIDPCVSTYHGECEDYTVNIISCTARTLSIGSCPAGTMTSGSTATLTATPSDGNGTVTWSSSNTSAATVNATTGGVTAVAPGTANITAIIAADGTYCAASATCTVNVTCATYAGTFAFSPAAGSVAEGATLDISAGLTAPTGATVTYTSGNTGVATVNATTGVVTGVADGTTTITAAAAQWTTGGITYCSRTTTYTITVTGDGCTKVGTGTTTSNTYGPLNPYYKYNYYQIIYEKSELGDCAGMINSIAFQYAYSTAMTNKTNVTIYMGETTKTAFASTTDWIASGDLTQVYTGDLNCSTGWNTFTLQNPFYYSNTGNLVVAIHDNSGSWDGSSYTFYYTADATDKMLYFYQDGSSAISMSSPSATNSGTTANRPNTKFCIDCCTPVTGTMSFANSTAAIVAGNTYSNTLNVTGGVNLAQVTYTISPTVAGVTISGNGTATSTVSTPSGIDQVFTVTATFDDGTHCAMKATYTLDVGDGCIRVGTSGLTSSGGYAPIYGYYYNSFAEMIYPASEIGECCMINSISFRSVNANNTHDHETWIYLGLTDKAAFSSSTDYVSSTEMTQVYHGNWVISEGWNTFEFDEPFDYNDCEKNLIIGMLCEATAYAAATSFYYSTATNSIIVASSDSYVPDPTDMSSWSGYNTIQDYRPDIKICKMCCTHRDASVHITNSCPIELAYGATVQLNGTLDAGAGAGDIIWTSSNSDAATVSGSGLVSAVNWGSTTIIYKRSYDGTYCPASTTCVVNIVIPTPTITQTDDPLPGCGDGDATLVASVTTGSVPPGFTYHWYSDAACTTEITTGVSGTNNDTLTYPAAAATQVWCRLEKASSTTETTFAYTGGIQIYTVPYAAESLTLEVWGAQGGDRGGTAKGGMGGYSIGTANPAGITDLYIVVGGSGNTGGTAGGYNGGGSRETYNGGGGATHIATSTGVLSSLSGRQADVLIVAGGGGSVGAADKAGGAGGGTDGESRTDYYGTGGGGGTQTTGGTGGNSNDGTFGQGGAGLYYSSGYGGAGGGGWYGGGGAYPDSSVDDDRGGGGGSGYLKTTLTDASTTTGQREGNGQAKITATIATITGPAANITLQCCGINATLEIISTP